MGDDTSTVSGLGTAKIGIGMKITEDLKVTAVTEGGPACVGGVRIGDKILALEGIPIDTRTDYKNIVRNYKRYDTVAHSIRRGSETISCDVTLGQSSRKPKVI
eukprot:NODE_954_length_540_cov_231.961259_g944_i0.p1 GENE.NODE_954_length_540_cov_231.961259_g944_i0~~NODE_954_length_540_cov_231.961259_g944_i0.p1  ORF type:complete len:111 (+),score=30.66 NODE_954_length_540_cov_231.961259_g944_i0:27-335(+)